MSPSLPISRSSSSSSFYFVHPDKNSLNGIPDCTKMAHITVLKESHHSKFQLYICSSCCWYSSSLQKRLYFRGQIDSQVESVESQIDSRGELLNWCRVLMWAAAVVCDLYIYLVCYFYTVDDVEQSEMRERFSCYFERVLIEKMAIYE